MRFDLPNGRVQRWEHIYLEDGLKGLYIERRGRILIVKEEVAEIPRATYYYYVKTSKKLDKYAEIKDESLMILEKICGYRTITLELKNRGYCINHKTVCLSKEDRKAVLRIIDVLDMICNLQIKDVLFKDSNLDWI